MVDWNLAVATATRLVRPGPEISREEAREVVAELRRHAKAAEEHVRSFTRMIPEGTEPEDTPVLVVDQVEAGSRPMSRASANCSARCWGRCRTGARAAPAAPCSARSAARSPASRSGCCCRSWPPGCSASTRRSPRPPASLPASADGGGRLLLVAPNIVHVERELDVDPHDFRLWVALHEETHRTQFTAVPWLRDHLQGEIQSFLDETDIDPMTVLERLREAAQSLAGGAPRARRARTAAAAWSNSSRRPPSARSSAGSPP